MLSRPANKYTPSTLAADVNRLCDPFYAYEGRSSISSTSSSPTSPSALGYQPKVYVDHAGQVHDPDYRDFPGMPALKRTTSASRRTSLSPSRAYRPAWERAFEPEEASDDEDSTRFYNPYGLRRVASSTATTPTLARSRSNSGSSWQPPVRQELYNFNHRASFEEEVEYQMQGNDDDDDEEDVVSDECQPQKQAPSCSEAIKYQMTALSMRVQFSVFRAKRRWRERRKSSSSG